MNYSFFGDSYVRVNNVMGREALTEMKIFIGTRSCVYTRVVLSLPKRRYEYFRISNICGIFMQSGSTIVFDISYDYPNTLRFVETMINLTLIWCIKRTILYDKATDHDVLFCLYIHIFAYIYIYICVYIQLNGTYMRYIARIQMVYTVCLAMFVFSYSNIAHTCLISHVHVLWLISPKFTVNSMWGRLSFLTCATFRREPWGLFH